MALRITTPLLLMALLACFSQQLYAEEVWIDVRSPMEHAVSNIDGDIRISHDDIVAEVVTLFPNRDTEIALYCRSGNRAGIAQESLKQAGYTNVRNAGGIDDARKERGID